VCGAPALTARVVSAAVPTAGTIPPAGTGARSSPPAAGATGAAAREAGSESALAKQAFPSGMSVAVLGGGGKSGSLSLAAARRAGAGRLVGVVPSEGEAAALNAAGLATEVVVADARDPVGLAAAVGEPVDVTVVCVDVPGCEHGAILATRPGGTVVFFSMATSFPAAALGAEGLAADVTMLIGNGYVPGHAELALDLVRTDPGLRMLFDARLVAD
jgi:L-erythro-3,5-diaminohexanoate dehydrogenase